MNSYDPLKKHTWIDSDTIEDSESMKCEDCGAVSRSAAMKRFLDDAPCVADEPTAGGYTFPELLEAATAAGCSNLHSTFRLGDKWFSVCGTSGDGGQPTSQQPVSFSHGDERVGRHQHSDWLFAAKMRGIAEKRDAQ